MSTLPLALVAPLAYFGNGTHERYRSTALLPTKSAVCGLLGACLGWERGDPRLAQLYQLRVHVRADQPGLVLTDFQTVAGTTQANGNHNPKIFVVETQFLQDVAFLVVLEGDRPLLDQIATHLKDPVFPVTLGKRACPLSRPLALAEAGEQSATELMATLPALGRRSQDDGMDAYLEAPRGNLTWHDQPYPGRRWGRRRMFHLRVSPPPAEQSDLGCPPLLPMQTTPIYTP